MPTSRIASLDGVRGLMLIASVGVNSLLAPAEWFDHAAWDGVHPIDLVFPIFVTLSGCGLAFALHRRVEVRPLLRRFVVLVLVGLLYNAVVLDSWQFDTWRFTGVLQLYAVVVVAMGLLHTITKTWQGWAIITAAVAAAHTTLLAVFAVRECADRILTPGCNPSWPIDMMVFGAHTFSGGGEGYDPEGLVAILGALVSAAAGATVGHLLLSLRAKALTTRGGSGGVGVTVLPILAIAAGLLVAAHLAIWLPELFGAEATPVMKKLWTAPFALRIAALTAAALLVGHLVLDRRTVPKLVSATSVPLIALGRNSLLVYFGSHVLMSLLARPLDSGSSVTDVAAGAIAIGGNGQATWTAVLLVFWIGIAMLLHRRGIYLRP